MRQLLNRRHGGIVFGIVAFCLVVIVLPVAAQAGPVCAVGSTESVDELQPGGAVVVATSVDPTKANAVCDMLVNTGGYSRLDQIPSLDNTQLVAAAASSPANPVQISVLASIDTAGFADAPSNRTILDLERAKAAAYDVQTAVPGIVLKPVH
jgi:hypothetical protein